MWSFDVPRAGCTRAAALGIGLVWALAGTAWAGPKAKPVKPRIPAPTEAKTEAKADQPDPDNNEFIITKRKDGTFRVTPRSLSRMVRLGPGPDRARAGAPKDEAAEPLGGPFVGKRPPIKEIVAGADLTGATLHPFFDPGDPLGTLKLYDLPDPQYRPRQILSGANGELFLLEPGKVESQSGAHRCSHLRPAERGPPPKPRPGLR